MSGAVAIDLMAAAAALAWALTGARAARGLLRAGLALLLGALALLLVLRSGAALGLVGEGWAIVVALALPPAILLCAEAVRGVHAPLWAKAAATLLPLGVLIHGGAVGEPGGAPAAALVIGALAGAAWWLWPRGTDGAGPRRRVALLFALALALALPLALTDFLPGPGPMPGDAGLGGLAVLVGVAVGARLTSAGGDPRAAVSLLLGAGALALFVALVLAAAGAAPRAAWPSVIPVVLAALLLAAVLAGSLGVAARAEEIAFLRALAEARVDDPVAALASLRGLPGLRDARLLGPGDLAEHDADALLGALSPRGVLRAGDAADPAAAEEAAHLLALHDADHLLLVSRSPLRLAALRLGPEDAGAGAWRLRALARFLAATDRGGAAP